MNPGGVRDDLLPAADRGRRVVTYEEAFNVQPFNNLVVTQTFTGAQLLDVLKDQWCGSAAVNVLLPSDTLHYTYDQSVAASIVSAPCASAANPVSDVTINGAALDPAASYRDHDEQLPRRRRGRLPVAHGGDGPNDAARTSTSTRWCEYLAPTLTGDAAASRRRTTASTSFRVGSTWTPGGGGPCAAAARSGTIAARDRA